MGRQSHSSHLDERAVLIRAKVLHSISAFILQHWPETEQQFRLNKQQEVLRVLLAVSHDLVTVWK